MLYFLFSISHTKILADTVSSCRMGLRIRAIAFGLASAVLASDASAESVRDYNIDVYAHRGTIPEIGAEVRVFNEAHNDSLVMYTGANGHARWLAGISGVGDVPSASNTLGSVVPNPLFGSGSVEYHAASKSVEDVRLSLYDVRGGRIASLHFGDNDLSSRLAAGSYVIRDDRSGDSARFVSLGGTDRLVVSAASVGADKSGFVLPMGADITVDNGDSTIRFDNITLAPPETVNAYDAEFGSPVYSGSIFGDAWDLLGDNPLRGGVVYVRNASGHVFSAPVDSSFVIEYDFASPSEELKVWFDHPDMSPNGVMFAQSGLAVRDRVAQAAAFVSPDTMRVAADNPYLSQAVRYKGVDQSWVDDPLWNGLLNGTHVTRGEDRPEEDGAWVLEGFTVQYDASRGVYGDPVIPSVLEDIEFLINYKKDLLTGAQPDGTVYGAVTAAMTEGIGGWDRGLLFVDDTATPGNWPYTIGGYTEFYFSSFPYGTPIGTKAAEFFGEELTDVNGTATIALVPGTGQLNNLGRAAFNAHYLFDDGVDFVPNY